MKFFHCFLLNQTQKFSRSETFSHKGENKKKGKKVIINQIDGWLEKIHLLIVSNNAFKIESLPSSKGPQNVGKETS